MKNPVEGFLALGSNQGDRECHLSLARQFLRPFFQIVKESSIYETPPWGYLDQPAFLNQVIQGKTLLPPHALLDTLKKIEKRMGRIETFRYGPRVIDMDILLFGGRLVNSQRLQVPHPRMHERAFVLVPLNEIAPGIILPGIGQTAGDLLKGLETAEIQKFSRPD